MIFYVAEGHLDIS